MISSGVIDEMVAMSNKLTEQQRLARECPDCGDGPTGEFQMHWPECRRVANGQAILGASFKEFDGETQVQCGPPWNDWPDTEPEQVERKLL